MERRFDQRVIGKRFDHISPTGFIQFRKTIQDTPTAIKSIVPTVAGFPPPIDRVTREDGCMILEEISLKFSIFWKILHDYDISFDWIKFYIRQNKMQVNNASPNIYSIDFAKASREYTCIHHLPKEMLGEIFGWVDELSHARCRRVCRRFRDISYATLVLDTSIATICWKNKGFSFQALSERERGCYDFSYYLGASGRNELFRYVIRKELQAVSWNQVMVGAAAGGQMELFKEALLVPDTSGWRKHDIKGALVAAAENHQWDIFIYILRQLKPNEHDRLDSFHMTYKIYQCADIEYVQEYARAFGNKININMAVQGAVAGGDIDLLQWLDQTYDITIEPGKQFVIEFSHDSKYQEVIDFLRQRGADILPPRCVYHAIKSNDNVDDALEDLRLLIQNGVTDSVIEEEMKAQIGAACNNMDDISYLLEIVKSLPIHNFVIDWNRVLARGCLNGFLDVVNFALKNGANDYNEGLISAFAWADYHAQGPIINLMMSLGANDWNAVVRECEWASPEAIQFALEQGADNWSDICAHACYYYKPKGKLLFEMLKEKCSKLEIDPVCTRCNQPLSLHDGNIEE